jgi:hypothetical protein
MYFEAARPTTTFYESSMYCRGAWLEYTARTTIHPSTIDQHVGGIASAKLCTAEHGSRQHGNEESCLARNRRL